MWTREELKNNAKISLNSNYWIFVLAAVVLTFLVSDGLDYNINFDLDNGISISAEGLRLFGDENINNSIGSSITNIQGGINHLTTGGVVPWLIGSVLAGLGIIVASASIAFKLFLCGPLEVGVNNTFLKGQNAKVEAKEIFSAFTSGAYMNIVLVQFLRMLFTALWTLLLIIPGIIKSYEYRMIPYLLAENPTMDRQTAFATSKEMMDGQKMNAFVLDLSFILWKLLSAITIGIVGIFYVNPYVESTNAQLYITLKANKQAYQDL